MVDYLIAIYFIGLSIQIFISMWLGMDGYTERAQFMFLSSPLWPVVYAKYLWDNLWT